MDIQFIGKSSLAIAQYVTGYVTKAEKSNMQEVWQEVSSHQTIYSKLWSFGVRCLRSRECGLYEASDLLLGDHLCGKSLTVKWVDVSQPHNRKCRLKDHSKLTEMRECNPNSTDIYEANLIDTFYPERPDNMEDVCLYGFVADYVKTGVDKDGNTTYRTHQECSAKSQAVQVNKKFCELKGGNIGIVEKAQETRFGMSSKYSRYIGIAS